MIILRIALSVLTPICLFGIDGVMHSIPISAYSHGGPIPRFGYGRLVHYGLDGVTVTAYKPDGMMAFSQVLSLPEAMAIRIRDVAISSEGKVAAVASAQDRSGRSVSLIVWFGVGGSQIRTVVTSPFAPFKICFSSDGFLWAVGRVHTDSFQTVPGHDLVRRYDAGGKLVQSSLSITDLAPTGKAHPGERTMFIPIGDGVSAFLPSAGEWIEFGPALQVTRRIRAPLPTGLLVAGFGRTRDGRAVVQAMTERSGEIPRIILLSLAPPSTEWKEMPIDDPFARSLLLGSDSSGNLVFWDKREQAVIWSSSPE